MHQITSTDFFSKAWYDPDHGKELLCTSLDTLTAYLFSDGALSASVSELSSVGIPSATIIVTGPRCHDGWPLWVSYKVHKSQLSRLPEEERQRFSRRLQELMPSKPPSWRLLAVVGLPR